MIEGTTAYPGALREATAFLDYVANSPELRQRGKVAAVGLEAINDISRLGEKKAQAATASAVLRWYAAARSPRGILTSLHAEAFQYCFVARAAALTGAPADAIAIDGETMRRPYREKARKSRFT